MNSTHAADDFLLHVFPGTSEVVVAFRHDIEKLNQYCHRHKGAITCVLLTGETGVGKTFTARAISAHSQWLRLSSADRRKYYDHISGGLALPAAQLIEEVLGTANLSDQGVVRLLATVHGPQLADDL